MAKGQNNGSFGGKKPPINNKNSSYLNKNTFPAIAVAFFRKLTGKQPEKKKVSSPAQIKLDNVHDDDGWD